MKTILVTGSRNWTDRIFILEIFRRFPLPVTLIHGACRGADLIAASCAIELGWTTDPHPANWNKYGPAAGPIRNIEMLDLGADIVVGFHDDIRSSKGTKHCIREAHARGIPVKLFSHFQASADSYIRDLDREFSVS